MSSSSSSEEPTLPPARIAILRALRVTGAILSILGSVAIITHVLKGQRYRKSPMHRLVLGLSIVDVWYSFHLAIAASFLYPIHEPSNLCTADAFFMMLGVASPLYNAALSYYYCFTVVAGMSNERFAQRYEPFFHVGVVVVASSAAVLGLFYDVYNPKRSGLGCWVGPYPSDCQEPEDCERGDNASARMVQLVGSIAPSSFSLLSMIINNIILYGNMRRLEARNRRYTSHFQRASTAVAPNNNNNLNDNNNSNSNNNSGPWRRLSLAGLRSSAAGLFRTSTATSTTTTNADRPAPPPPKPVSRRMAVQSFCYVGAFWMSYGWGFVHFALLSANKNYFPLQAIGFFFYPAQGFLNAVVYLRPNYLRWRDAGESRMGAVKYALFSLQAPRRRRRPGPPPHATAPPRRPPVQDLTDGSNTEDDGAPKYAKPKEDEDIEVSMMSSDSFSSSGGDGHDPQRGEPPSKSAADLA